MTNFVSNQVHGNVAPGVFLTGTFEFFAVTLSGGVVALPTNVKLPLAKAQQALNVTTLSAGKSVTVVDGFGVSQTYTSDAAYTAALNKQANLDRLISVFATRANPVMISVATNGATVNLATERSPLWFDGADNTNTNGYNLVDAFAGVPAQNATDGAGAYSLSFAGNIAVATRAAL